jgi:hypothetical protein
MARNRSRKKRGNKRDPQPISLEEMQAEVLAAMESAGTPPEYVYAYRKTGLLGTEGNKERLSREDRKLWEQAVDEYRALEDAAKKDRPPQEQWSSKIPELLIAPFTQANLDQIRQCFTAMAPIERRGMTLIMRIEIAAALLVTACEHAYDAAEELGEPETAADRFAHAEQLVLRRAREIYAQGHA